MWHALMCAPCGYLYLDTTLSLLLLLSFAYTLKRRPGVIPGDAKILSSEVALLLLDSCHNAAQSVTVQSLQSCIALAACLC